MKQNTHKTIRFFLKHAKKHKILLTAIILSLILGTVAYMGWYLLLRNFFAALIQDQSKAIIIPQLIHLLINIITLELIEWGCWRVFQHCMLYFQAKCMTGITNECFDYLHQHSYQFFSNNFSGALVKKVTRLVNAFERIFDKIFWDMGTLILRIIIISAVLFYLHPVLGTIMAIWVVIFLIINYRLSIYKLKFDLPRAEQDSVVTANLADTITNNTNIKLFASHEYEFKKFSKITNTWYERTRKAWVVDAYIDAGQALLMYLLEVAIIYAAIKLWQRDLIMAADFIIIQTYLLELFHQIWAFGRNLRDIYESLADSEEMTAILNTRHEIQDLPDAGILKIKAGKVEFKNVSFSYKNISVNSRHGEENFGNTHQEDERVIKNLSFAVRSGQKIALIGPSGGGKSTIVKLLLRLFDIDKGQILVDGRDISKVTQESLHKQIAMVPQDPILFHRSLRENICYGNDKASNEEIIAASKMAHCHEFIKKFPQKYETFVGERGIKLSGGQRQRVAIARAIIGNANILILDEATSSLDSESEKLIQEALKNLIKNKTTFIIAHRLSTIMNVDRIFVLENGRIIEEGTHADLIQKESGLYKKLWNLQVGGYMKSN